MSRVIVSKKVGCISLVIAGICLIGTLIASEIIEYNTISYIGEVIVGIGWLLILYILSWTLMTKRVR